MACFIRLLCLAVMASLLCFAPARGQALSLDVEALRVPGVGAGWQTIPFVNTYTSPVVTCTYNLPTSAAPPAATRVRNVGTTSFEVRIQQFESNDTVTASDVHCLVVEQGAHTLPSGLKIEAHTVLATQTNGLALGWGTSQNVTLSKVHTYATLIVFGQVMTFDDTRASVFWTNNCVTRGAAPNNSSVCVGKHIGQINSTRANETLGYIFAEAGAGTDNDVNYLFGIGTDSIAGVGNSPPYNYSVSGDFDTGVLASAGEDGGQGGWAVLYGADPLPNNQVGLAIDEETVAGDTSRTHTQEQVFYGLFDDNQTHIVNAEKSVSIYTSGGSAYALPGNDVIYTLTATSTGSKPIDRDGIFMIDSLPEDTAFYNGDVDDGGPETSPVAFTTADPRISFTPATDLAFSNAAAPPTNFAACTYTALAGYDPAIRHVCFAPKGQFAGGTLVPSSEMSFEFRARIE